jgi:hypothetical protein
VRCLTLPTYLVDSRQSKSVDPGETDCGERAPQKARATDRAIVERRRLDTIAVTVPVHPVVPASPKRMTRRKPATALILEQRRRSQSDSESGPRNPRDRLPPPAVLCFLSIICRFSSATHARWLALGRFCAAGERCCLVRSGNLRLDTGMGCVCERRNEVESYPMITGGINRSSQHEDRRSSGYESVEIRFDI